MPTMLPYPSIHTLVGEVRSAAADWFAGRKLATDLQHRHVLSNAEDWRQNLILPEMRDYIDGESAAAKEHRRCPFALHSAIRNGASSQAMGFNLVGPLITRDDLAPLRATLAAVRVPWPANARATFEVESRAVFNERSGQPTSIDLVISDDSAATGGIFVEIKLTESGFGGCGTLAGGKCAIGGKNPLADLAQCYLHHKDYRYWQRIEEHGLRDAAMDAADHCPLAFHYQFFRELLFALHHGGHFVLLHDARNPIFAGASGSVLPQLVAHLPSHLQTRVAVITVQQLVATIHASGRHADWIEEFTRKYGLAMHEVEA